MVVTYSCCSFPSLPNSSCFVGGLHLKLPSADRLEAQREVEGSLRYHGTVYHPGRKPSPDPCLHVSSTRPLPPPRGPTHLHPTPYLPPCPIGQINFGPRVIVQEGYSRPQEGKKRSCWCHKTYIILYHPASHSGLWILGPRTASISSPSPRFPPPHLDCTRRLESLLASCLVSSWNPSPLDRSSSLLPLA